MKRFLYDAILFIILIMIGTSMKSEEFYKDKQKELNSFENEIQKKESVLDHNYAYTLPQIKDNKATTIAKNISGVIKESIKISVRLATMIFEDITK